MRVGGRRLLATCAIAIACCGDDDAALDAGALDATTTDARSGDATLDAALDVEVADVSASDATTMADSGRDGASDADAMDAARDDGGDARADAMAASDLGTMDATTDDLGTSDSGSSDSGTSDSGARCFLEGRWHLEEIRCDAMDVTADWRMTIPSSTLEITTNAMGDCHIATTHAGPTCREVQEVDAQADGSWLSLGITTCEPAACQFTPTDAPCTIGDRAGVQRPAVERTGDRFTVTWMPDEAGGFCGRFGMTTRETFALD